jgi:hypothetical protein
MSTMNNLPSEDDGRRERRRFPIQQDVRYQCVKGSRIFAVGVGKTLEVSSSEVRFTTQQPLKQGQKVRLAMNWPAMLDKTCRMKLEIFGWIVHSEPGEAAVKIERYEFRTRGAQTAAILPQPSARSRSLTVAAL